MAPMSATLEGIKLGILRKRLQQEENFDLKNVLGETPVLVFRPSTADAQLLFQTPSDDQSGLTELAGDTNVFDRKSMRGIVYAHNDAVVVPLTVSNRNLYDDQVLVGRGRTNDIRLKSREVSKSHCAFSNIGGEGWTITDLNSSNGTRVNGIELEADRPYKLRSSDEIEISELTAVFLDSAGLLGLTTLIKDS